MGHVLHSPVDDQRFWPRFVPIYDAVQRDRAKTVIFQQAIKARKTDRRFYAP
jgi:hypothetical protein